VDCIPSGAAVHLRGHRQFAGQGSGQGPPGSSRTALALLAHGHWGPVLVRAPCGGTSFAATCTGSWRVYSRGYPVLRHGWSQQRTLVQEMVASIMMPACSLGIIARPPQMGWTAGLVSLLTLVGVSFTFGRAGKGHSAREFLLHLGYNP